MRVGGRKVSIEENAVDRAIRFLSPARANDRARARMAAAVAGGYIGASTSRRQTMSWQAQKGDADAVVLSDLPTLRERSRDLMRNAPLAVGAVSTVITNVIGTGLRHKSRIDRDGLRLTEAHADAWEASVDREWLLWSESAECDMARTLRFKEIMELAFRQTLENGDVFALMPNLIRTGSPYGLKIQLVEGDRVCNANDARDAVGLAGGVARDKNGAPTAYHILNQHPGSSFYRTSERSWTVVPAFGKTGRRNVIHLFKTLRPGQSRGVPYLAPVIEPLKQLDRYTEAEIMAAVVSGMFTVFVKSETGGTSLSPMEPSAETGGSASDDDFKMASGAILNLAKGEEIQTANPMRPNAGFDPFVMSVLRQIGVALELPFEVLIKHFTASYSAARSALLEAWKFFRSRREWIAQNFCQAVYENWMDEAVALGRVKAPGYFADPLIRQAYLWADWIGPAPGQIDPLKEITAAEKRVALTVSTRLEETMALTGGDWEDNVRQAAKERRMLKEADLVEVAPAAPGKTHGAEPPEPEEKEAPEDEDQVERGEET
ncbi:MAG: phage portal protein [Deltaproteobacteria bacterium]|nr:phage portal protein [Deltaproteobacteria bacterium]